VSEFAHKQLSTEDMETEYGPVELKIRLAPTAEQLAQIQAELEEERSSKKKHKKKGTSSNSNDDKNKKKEEKGALGVESVSSTAVGKRKRSDHDTTRQAVTGSSSSSSLTKVIQSRVDSALESNQVLSSLFVDKKGKSNQH
jgi:hypothetical protein